MLSDRNGKPLSPPEPASDAPKTGASLREHIEAGELGDVVYEGGAAAELESKRKTINLHLCTAAGALETWAGQIEQAASKEKDIQKRHILMDTARGFRVSVNAILRHVAPPETPEEKAHAS